MTDKIQSDILTVILYGAADYSIQLHRSEALVLVSIHFESVKVEGTRRPVPSYKINNKNKNKKNISLYAITKEKPPTDSLEHILLFTTKCFTDHQVWENTTPGEALIQCPTTDA